jgi:hypothetical protein
LRLAIAAYLARYKGLSRYHTESDLRVFLRWCADRGLDPLALRRVDVELFVRWLQEVGQFKPWCVDTGMTDPLRTGQSMEGGSVDELLDVTVERPGLDQLQVEVGRTLEDRVQAGLTGDDREERHLHAVD